MCSSDLFIVFHLVLWSSVFFQATSIPHCTALHFIVLHGCCIFYKLKVCGNPALSKSIGTVFPTTFAYFVCHILLILAIF